MKKLIFIILLFITPSIISAQKKEEHLFKEYTENGYYKIDNGEIVASKIIDSIPGTKDEIYNKVKSYFVRAYKDSKSVIQTDDKEGGLIIGKGLYTNLSTFALGLWTLKAYHILRVDVKEGRIRVICSVSTIIPNSSEHLGNELEYTIISHFPFTNKRADATKGAQLKAFLNLIARMNDSIAGIEEAVKNGVISEENNDW